MWFDAQLDQKILDSIYLAWPDLFVCKQLSLVVNKQGQWTMKTIIKIFLGFCCLELKVENCTILIFKVIFYVKNWQNPSDFFFH